MSASLPEFLERLLHEGRVTVGPRIEPGPDDGDRAAAILRRAFEDEVLNLAGPPLEFDGATALKAAGWTWRACRLLPDRAVGIETIEEMLPRLKPPPRPAAHLSADVSFRYLPSLLRRARSIAPDDPIARLLVETLRLWPLSGALADVDQPPITAVDFQGHPGLKRLYLERLVAADRDASAWAPDDPEARDWIALTAATRRGGPDADDAINTAWDLQQAFGAEGGVND